MAEAHQATHYSTSKIHQHIEGNHDQETLEMILSSGGHSWKTKSANRIKNFIYPARIEILYATIGLAFAQHFNKIRLSFEVLTSFSFITQISFCILTGLLWFGIICIILKVTMMLLLRYQGYMYETRGRKVSLKTKVWAMLMKAFLKFNPPQLYSFQSLLPRLSVPTLKDTIKRYLRSIRPLFDDETYNRIAKEAEEFQNGIGKKFQRYLILKSWWASNYVSDWWEEFVYLKSSTPLMVNSNVFSSDHISRDTTIQSARAANVCYLFLQFRKSIDDQTLKPIMANNLVPLCSTQYQRIFNTTRIPGIDGDKLQHFETSDHIAVLHKGCYYKVIICVNGRLLKPREIQEQFETIINSNDQTSHGEKYLASLTAWDRTKWAATRDKYFSSGINKKSLDIIESAAFVLNLHDGPYIMDLVNPDKQPEVLSHYCTQNFFGRIYDFWFDKSFNVCFGTNGRMAFNAEHSWGDAPAISRMLEESMVYDIKSYDSQGNIIGKIEIKPPSPVRLNWDFSDQNLIEKIDEAYADGLKLINDVDYQCVVHHAFGKGLMKECKLSPDAFIQMALQLAYFRDFGRFSLTYEASMTRLFKDGRTETVRPCTIESCAWVRAMENPKVSTQERVKLLQEACKRHQKGYLEAMTGKGIDRHLFCLFVVSKYLEIDSPFLKEILNEPWRLSTSQTPHGQSDFVDLKKYPQIKCCAGGFGPVSKDGYGISYIISGEDRIYFHVSSFKSSLVTDTDRFGKRIRKALWDIKELIEKFNSEQIDD